MLFELYKVMKKFILFDIDGTLIHESYSLSTDTLDFLQNFSDIEYGVCTNRPLLDTKDLIFLNKIKYYICEGGTVSYTSDKTQYRVHPDAIYISHESIALLAQKYLKNNQIQTTFSQNKRRVYTSTLNFNEPLCGGVLWEIGHYIITHYPLINYKSVIVNNSKISFTLSDVSKEYMIQQIPEIDHHYFLISDNEPESRDFAKEKMSYISINPANRRFNEKCAYVSRADFDERIIDSLSYIRNLDI